MLSFEDDKASLLTLGLFPYSTRFILGGHVCCCNDFFILSIDGAIQCKQPVSINHDVNTTGGYMAALWLPKSETNAMTNKTFN